MQARTWLYTGTVPWVRMQAKALNFENRSRKIIEHDYLSNEACNIHGNAACLLGPAMLLACKKSAGNSRRIQHGIN